MYSDLCADWLKQQQDYAIELYNLYFTLSVINGILSIAAVIGNILVIVAVKKSSSLKSPSFLLLTNLALSDLGVGLLAQPMYITYKVSEMNSWRDIHCYVAAAYFYIAILFVFVSFGTICYISIDRFLAVHLGIRYRSIVKLNRVTVAIIALWFVSIVLGAVYLVSVLAYFFSELLFITISLLLTTFLYFKIVRKLSLRQVVMRVHVQPEGTQSQAQSRVNATRFKRSVYSMLFVYVAFVLCYTPFFCFRIMLLALGRNTAVNVASNVTLTIVFMNSSLNPVLYYWRIPEIRRAVRDLVGLQNEESTGTITDQFSSSIEQAQRK